MGAGLDACSFLLTNFTVLYNAFYFITKALVNKN